MTGYPNPETPELNKMLECNNGRVIIGAFLEWARERGYHFTETVPLMDTRTYLYREGTYEVPVDTEVPIGIEKALAEYFEIDLTKVEEERRALLKAQAALNEKHRTTYTVHPEADA